MKKLEKAKRVSDEDYKRASLWYTEQYNSLSHGEVRKFSEDERKICIRAYDVLRIRTYNEMIDLLEEQIESIKQQQDILKSAVVSDWEKIKKIKIWTIQN